MHQNFYKLMNQLSKPSKVASTLDWKKSGSTLLSLNIHRNRIGLAVASHPSLGSTQCLELEPLKFGNGHISIDTSCLERFQNVIQDYNVCGIVVSWPLQHETGRMGAACGRVLYALEEIVDKSKTVNGSINGNVLSPSRPLCLWDSGHILPKQKANPKMNVDAFGRCAQYGHATSGKQEHVASKEQYHEDELTVVQQVWNDFCQEHWPEFFEQALAKESTTAGVKRIPLPHTLGTYNRNKHAGIQDITWGKNGKLAHLQNVVATNKPKKSLVQMGR